MFLGDRWWPQRQQPADNQGVQAIVVGPLQFFMCFWHQACMQPKGPQLCTAGSCGTVTEDS